MYVAYKPSEYGGLIAWKASMHTSRQSLHGLSSLTRCQSVQDFIRNTLYTSTSSAQHMAAFQIKKIPIFGTDIASSHDIMVVKPF